MLGAVAGGAGTPLGRIRAGRAEGLKLLPFPSVAVQSGLWPALLARMKIDLEGFITRHLDQIIPSITTQSPLNQVIGMWTNSGLRSECQREASMK